MENKSILHIGPLTFAHQVQKISIQERKAIDALESTRSKKHFIVDSGESENRAQIRFLFSSLEEVNGPDSEENGVGKLTSLRSLIALFKCCPITTIENSFLSTSWKETDEIYDTENFDNISKYLQDLTRINQEILDSGVSTIEDASVANSNREVIEEIQWSLASSRSIGKIPTQLTDGSILNYPNFNVELPFGLTRKNKIYSRHIPIALEYLELENVPDIPYGIQATLGIARIDVTSVTENGMLEYIRVADQPNVNNKTETPYLEQEDTYLKRWIRSLLSRNIIPKLSDTEYYAKFDWYGKTAIGTPLETNTHTFSVPLKTDSTSSGYLASENCGLRHKIAYNKMLGKRYPMAMHMGTSARFLSLDIVFNNQKDDSLYRNFCKFKDTSDQISKSKERYDRVTGWKLHTPVSRLLGTIDEDSFNTVPGMPWAGVFVPVSIFTETSEVPNFVNARLDLLENNIDFYSDNEVMLSYGGTDFDSLKEYYNLVVKDEYVFRSKLSNAVKRQELFNNLVNGADSEIEGYSLFWPVEKSIINIKKESQFGILNIDTIRAVLLEMDTHGNYDKGDSSSTDYELYNALTNCSMVTGELIANRKIRLYDKIKANINFLTMTIGEIDIEDPQIARIYQSVYNIVKGRFFASSQAPDLYKIIAVGLTKGLIGDREDGIITSPSETGKVIEILSKSSEIFSQDFYDALFDVVVERRSKPRQMPYIYSTDGVYAGFYKLITAYSLNQDKVNSGNDTKEIRDLTANDQSNSMFPDLLLPTFEDLFGDVWESYSPTFSDLGIDTYDESADEPACSATDVVSPAVWFYTKREKSRIKQFASDSIKEVNKASPAFSISVPFNTEEIERLKEAINKKKLGLSDAVQSNIIDNTISEIISNAFRDHRKNNPSAYREDIVSILSNGDRFEKKYLSDEGSVKLYVHHNNNYVLPREITVPGLGAEIYRVINNEKELQTAIQLPRLDADATYTTPLDKSVAFHRHLDENNEKAIASAIDQIPDDHYSPERMFPAIKVYLLDKRGNDIIADDTLFSINAIVSVDITLDKEDAPLAVIKIADPLYALQNDYFSKSNIVHINDNGNLTNTKTKRVSHNLKAPDANSNIRRYKLVQGRSVQIRMGYSSMAYNLPIVFTGRITEIVPGDELTVVCQGWKAELINNQVNFYNDDPKNWGARDLAIQAIKLANPEGFGNFYPQMDANFILRNMDPLDVETMLGTTINNSEGVDVESNGSRGYGMRAANWLARFVGLASTDKDNKGFDTRLKNIWYPDTRLYGNLFGLRSRFGVMPSWLNDSWVVPLQPAWDVLKEASRHAWNCIVDVVPYDTEATIFMGHPDQLYYYTKGGKKTRKAFKKYHKDTLSNNQVVISELLKSFLNSIYYENNMRYSEEEYTDIIRKAMASTPDIYNNSASSERQDLVKGWSKSFKERYNSLITYPGFQEFKSFKQFESFYISLVSGTSVLESANKAIFGLSGYGEEAIESYKKSKLPISVLDQVKSKTGKLNISLYLVSTFFGVEPGSLLLNWPNIERDINELLLADDSNELDFGLSKVQIGPYVKDQATKQTILAAMESISRHVSSANNTFSFEFSNNRRSIRRELDDLKRLVPANTLGIHILIDKFQMASDSYKSFDNTPKVLEENKIHVASMKSALVEIYFILQKHVNSNNFLRSSGVLSVLRPGYSEPLSEALKDNFVLFKAFVYYFCRYVLEDTTASQKINQLVTVPLPPNMRVFRVHHFANDDHNIIQNNIVATTREMWNTVVVEHPSPGTDNDHLSSDTLYRQSSINAGSNWSYWPKSEVTGVIGLQFHPGLTLSNKKVKVFTELNCQNPDLAAKLACGHLAEGIRKMYRGTILLIGKNMKPHDRIVLADSYTKMSGTVEVESVIHHWNVHQGWITNVAPNAVCDANPGASILQTACLETTYQAVFNTLDFVSDVVTIATIIGTLGGATPLAIGQYSLKKSSLSALRRFLTKNPVTGLKEVGQAAMGGGAGLLSKLKVDVLNASAKGHRLDLIKTLVKELGGPVVSYYNSQVAIGMAQWGSHMAFKSNIISGFIESSGNVEQLPVILSPLIFNGTPFTAGLEVEDSIWGVAGFGLYYSMKQLQGASNKFIEDLLESFKQ